jgi:hypothetical protein
MTPDDRMMKIWSLQEIYGPSMIFWDGPKLQHPGFGWAAATFLRGWIYNATAYGLEPATAQLAPSGLLVQYPGVVLSGLINPVPAFYFRDDTSRTYQVILLRRTKGKVKEEDCLEHSLPGDPTRHEKLAVTMSRPLEDQMDGEKVICWPDLEQKV